MRKLLTAVAALAFALLLSGCGGGGGGDSGSAHAFGDSLDFILGSARPPEGFVATCK